ncbi:MAG: MinD/ParA family protein [Desulfovibrionaceae bacterium]|jgi:flagellar biosynthesis protein FlhG|nr:MinD/ParA family protein [Desulfovibrionaceae bacterium]
MDNKTLSVAIMSGKGGVGKTNLALNLGFCLFKGNHPVVLMDCDLGLANLDVLLGLAPDKNLQDVIDHDVPPEDILVPIEPGGFDFLPAASGVPELFEMDEDMRALLLSKLHPVFADHHYLFMDLGAGINPTVLSFASMSRVRIIVVTPEPTSLTDGYALIKVLATQRGVKDFLVVVNQVESKAEEQQTFSRLNMACEKFLGFGLTLLGSVRMDKALPESVRRQVPLMKRTPDSPAGKDLFALARKLHSLRASLLPQLAGEPVLVNFSSGTPD